VPATAAAQTTCPAGSACLSGDAIRTCDAAEARLPAVERELAARAVELAASGARLVLAQSDGAALSRALVLESARVVQLQADVEALRPWLPAWVWWLGGVGLGVLGTLAAALAL
jgi:hypothetical protein